jgi:hypothetical protein
MSGLIFVICMVIVVIAVAVVGWRIGRAQAAPQPVPDPVVPTVTPQTIEELNRRVEEAYSQKVTEATKGFGEDLTATSKRLGEQVERLTTNVITSEIQQYQKTLDQVRAAAEGASAQIQQAVTQQQTELRTAMEATIKAEQERRLGLIDARLADIVTSYITESLGAGVDLGAQTDYIVQALEARREDIKKDLSHGL